MINNVVHKLTCLLININKTNFIIYFIISTSYQINSNNINNTYFTSGHRPALKSRLFIYRYHTDIYRVAQNKIPHQTICNILATSDQILKILGDTDIEVLAPASVKLVVLSCLILTFV